MPWEDMGFLGKGFKFYHVYWGDGTIHPHTHQISLSKNRCIVVKVIINIYCAAASLLFFTASQMGGGELLSGLKDTRRDAFKPFIWIYFGGRPQTAPLPPCQMCRHHPKSCWSEHWGRGGHLLTMRIIETHVEQWSLLMKHNSGGLNSDSMTTTTSCQLLLFMQDHSLHKENLHDELHLLIFPRLHSCSRCSNPDLFFSRSPQI